MLKVLVKKGKNKSMVIKPELLIGSYLEEIISEKVGKQITQEDLVSFDGKKVIYSDSEAMELYIPEADLLTQSITQWVKKYLKTKGAVDITVESVGK